MKKCTMCGITKPINNFYKSTKYSCFCQECFTKYITHRFIKLKIKSITYKGGKCIDCGLSFPDTPYSVFDFHHLDAKEKEFSWNKMRKMSWEKIVKELDKCVLLCSNCHRIRHHEERETFIYPHPNLKTPTPNECVDCGKTVKTKRCGSCHEKFRSKTKINWPPVEEIINLTSKMSFLEVGRLLGVSDNAIRKHLKKNNVRIPNTTKST